MAMVPIAQGMNYLVSHRGDAAMQLQFLDAGGRAIGPAFPSPGEYEAPEGSYYAVVVKGPGTIYGETLKVADGFPKTIMPDRLSIDPTSRFYNGELIRRGVGVRFKGVERTNVAEYCLSEGWVRLQTGVAKDRSGRAMLVKLQGAVEVWMRDEA